jgi:DNA-binding helix-hairpin-helix protein with protein kinase domain
MSQYLDEQGRPLRLGTKLGEGGEGAVYRLTGQSSQAIKVYTAPLSVERIQKIRILAQLNRPDIGRFTAWPTGLVMDERGRARGLLLPVVERGKDIHHLYTPSSRRQHFPEATWRFLVHVGSNVARAFHAVHSLGLVIGDVNPGSILVLNDGTVRLIDVDSFQVPAPGGQTLLCTVAVPLFLPPELQKAPLQSTIRSPNHDAFGLAVTIFQLLMLGRHPYAGRYLGAGEMPIERAIAENRFAYGTQAAARDMKRPPNAVGMEILPDSVAALFEAAFTPGATPRSRPSAEDWVQALQGMVANLTQCGRSPAHHYPKSTSACPWCPLEQAAGVLLFGTPKARSPQKYESDYQRLLHLVGAVAQPQPLAPATRIRRVAANPAARSATKTPGSAWSGYIIGVLLILGGVALAPVGVLFIALGAAAIVLGVSTSRRRRLTWVDAYRAAKTEYASAARQLDQANSFPGYVAARTAAQQASQSWDDLPRVQAQKHQKLERNKRQTQLQQFLQRQMIEKAVIAGIGPGRVAMLSAYGIDTAFDLVATRIAQVPQFGPVLTDRLVSWRHACERAFVYDASRPLPRETVRQLEREIEDDRRRLVEDLRRAHHAMEQAKSSEAEAAAAAVQRLATAAHALRQAEADVLAATGNVPG